MQKQKWVRNKNTIIKLQLIQKELNLYYVKQQVTLHGYHRIFHNMTTCSLQPIFLLNTN